LQFPAAHPFYAVVELPRDDLAERPMEPTAGGSFHWAPHHDNGFHARMDAVARWIGEARPDAFVTDVSVEIATLVRLLGVPVIVMALPGERFDTPHLLVHRLADHIIAAWPQELLAPGWLRVHEDKTSYVGGISRYDDRARPAPDGQAHADIRVLVLAGAMEDFRAAIGGCARACPGTTWTAIGGANGAWVEDPWPQICAADVVVTAAGQGAIADIAAARRRAVVIPQPRPFDEQAITAHVLGRHRLATVAAGWPESRAWPGLIAHAMATDPATWRRWQVCGAAARAAAAIETTAARCAKAVVP
jgi:hypothetical protein